MNHSYSSFSQTKGLLWKQQFDGILTGNFLPPVGAVIDLTDKCQLNCEHCNAQGFRSKNILTLSHVKDVVADLANWGVKSVCYAGGGEPSIHPNFARIIDYSVDSGLEVGISTNGVDLTPETIETLGTLPRFVGVSVDAGRLSTWMALKHGTRKQYESMIRNCGKLCVIAKDTQVDTTYKFMITPHNQHEIYHACKVAKMLDFKNFFVRPAAFENIPGLMADYRFNVKRINAQLKLCSELQTPEFQVYSSMMRVDKNLKRVMPFKRCLATPLLAVYCADGYSYLCIDYRERIYGRLCEHLELRNFWGSPEHKKMIAEIDLSRCPRCAFSHYQEQIQSYQTDYMYQFFP